MKRLSAILLTLFLTLVAGGVSAGICPSYTFNPDDLNWGVSGAHLTVGSNPGGNVKNPPLMNMPSVCSCPSLLLGEVNTPGVGITFWEPRYMVDVVREAGCAVGLGGTNMLGPQYRVLQGDTGREKQGAPRMQVHWFDMSLSSIIGVLKDIGCTSLAGISGTEMSELQLSYQNDMWEAISDGIGVLVSSPLAQMACVADGVMATFKYPLDPLFWCAGAQGSLYPLTGNANLSDSPYNNNLLILSKFIAREMRDLKVWLTIGPTARCVSHPMPIPVKSQFRVDLIWPVAKHPNKPVYVGRSELTMMGWPPTNFPTRESSVYYVWQARQCCLRP